MTLLGKGAWERNSSPTVLKQLHWLPVYFQVQFKLLMLALKALGNLGPKYLKDVLHPYRPIWAIEESAAWEEGFLCGSSKIVELPPHRSASGIVVTQLLARAKDIPLHLVLWQLKSIFIRPSWSCILFQWLFGIDVWFCFSLYCFWYRSLPGKVMVGKKSNKWNKPIEINFIIQWLHWMYSMYDFVKYHL